jgi:hypothetical protein
VPIKGNNPVLEAIPTVEIAHKVSKLDPEASAPAEKMPDKANKAAKVVALTEKVAAKAKLADKVGNADVAVEVVKAAVEEVVAAQQNSDQLSAPIPYCSH